MVDCETLLMSRTCLKGILISDQEMNGNVYRYSLDS